MLTLNTKVTHADTVFAQLVLPYELRENSRLRTRLASGEEVAIFSNEVLWIPNSPYKNLNILQVFGWRIVYFF